MRRSVPHITLNPEAWQMVFCGHSASPPKRLSPEPQRGDLFIERDHPPSLSFCFSAARRNVESDPFQYHIRISLCRIRPKTAPLKNKKNDSGGRLQSINRPPRWGLENRERRVCNQVGTAIPGNAAGARTFLSVAGSKRSVIPVVSTPI